MVRTAWVASLRLRTLGVGSGPHQDEAARDGRNAAGADGGGAILRRGLTDEIAETATERAEAAEADEEADLGDRQVGRPQQRLRPLDSPPGQVPLRRLAVRARERAREVEPRVARLAGHRLEIQRQ